MADNLNESGDSLRPMPRTPDEEAMVKGEEEDGVKSEEVSDSSRSTSTSGGSSGNAQEVLLAISKVYTSRLGTEPPYHSEYVEAPPSPDSAPLQASGSSPVGESETTAPATPSAPVTPGAVAAPSSASASPFRPPVPLFDEDYEDDAPVPLSDEDDTPVPLSDEDYEDDAGQQEPVVVAEATAAATMATTAASPRRPPVPLFHEDYVDDPGQQESVAVAEATAAAEATMATTAARVAAAAAMTAGAVVTTPPKAFRRQRQGVRRRHSTGSAEEYLEMGKNARYRRRRRRRSELERDANENQVPKVMDLREAVRSGSVENVKASLNKRSNVLQELMAQNATNGAGLLMLAVLTGKVHMLAYLATEMKARLGTTILAKQLRYEDDTERPLMFYAAASSLAMFRAAKKLVRDTIGRAGLTEQLRHRCARNMNLLMKASSDAEIFAEVWALAERARCLDELKEQRDFEGRNWILHAAEAGNLAVFKQLDGGPRVMYNLFSAVDSKGWSGFMYAARGKGDHNVDFLTMLCGMCFPDEKDPLLSEQLTRVAEDDDASTLLMHAAIGGREPYAVVCRMIREAECVDRRGDLDRDPVLLSWAAQGGDVQVLNAVSDGIKTGHFQDGVEGNLWYEVSSAQESARLLDAIETCAKRRAGVSLFLSAIESSSVEMMNVVLEGIKDRVEDPKVCWELLCGIEGNPLTVAASKSVESFRAALREMQRLALRDSTGVLKPEVRKLLLPGSRETPLCSAVFSEDPLLFDEVLKQARLMCDQHPGWSLSADTILRQVKDSMRDVDEETRQNEGWISAKMLAKVLQAAKEAGKDERPVGFDVSKLDDFVQLAVYIGAFDHLRELLKFGCDLVKHFPALLTKIEKNETSTSECIMLAITAASNPFVECGIASQAVYEATINHNMNHVALERLHQRIGDFTMELLEHLPRSVSGVGDELARGDPDLEPFEAHIVGKIKPSELLGFVVVGWMLEGSGQASAPDDSRSLGGENALAQAVRSGPRALDLLSEALVLDYLGLKFSHTLPRWNTQKPFERNINQALYSYTHKAAKESDGIRTRGGVFQRLLLLLQGWRIKSNSFPHYTVLPGLQFTLAGIMGKPVSYYVVPAIRMLFIVINYLATVGLYLSCVSLDGSDVPPNEWAFYLVMLGVAWREVLEFSNAQKLEPGLGASIERYFYDKWNFLDVTTIALVFVAFVFRMIELATERSSDLFIAQFFMAATAPFLFSRVLFLSQVGSTLGPMTQVIFNMVTQLAQFSVVLLLVMLGFAASFNALYGDDTILVEQKLADCDVKDHPIVEAFGSLRAALLTMFEYMLGEFTFETFYARYENADGEDCGGVEYEEFGVTLLVIYLVIMAVMLLNLLIAVLSTAHSEIQKNAAKEFQLARAKIILQSGEDVINDVIPPPFNLVKPVLGFLWPVSSRVGGRCDRWWEIATGTIHRILFWFVVGLVALAISILLWVVSTPLRAWKIYQQLRGEVPEYRTEADRQGKTRKPSDLSSGRRPIIRRRHQPQLRPLIISDAESSSQGTNGNGLSDIHEPMRFGRDRSMQPRSFRDVEIAAAIERIFFVDSGARQRQCSPMHALSAVLKVFQMLVAIVMAVFSCLVVYPVLSFILWIRGFGNVVHYVKQMQSKRTRWERRQVDLGEEEEWSVARTQAIRRNRRYATENSSENEFNVDALLKTTTGLTMDDLRQNMANLKSARRRRALTASLDAVLAQFPSEDKVRLEA